MQMQMMQVQVSASLSTRLITPIAANVRFPSPPPLHPLRATPPPPSHVQQAAAAKTPGSADSNCNINSAHFLFSISITIIGAHVASIQLATSAYIYAYS